MNKYNTKKRFFELNLVNHPIKNIDFMININNTDILDIYEYKKYIGFYLKSNTTYTLCKNCNSNIKRNKGYNEIYLNYANINNKIVLVKIKLKKYYCINCKSTTIEKLIDRNGKNQSTNSVIKAIIDDLKTDSTYSSVSKRYNECITNIIKRFDIYASKTTCNKKVNINAIGVDEVSIIKSNNNKYQFVVIDHNTSNIIDIIDGRKKDNVLGLIQTKYLNVNYVTMDLWKTYKDAFLNTFNNVTVIADRFHVVRTFMWAFSRSRIALFKQNNIGTTKYWKILTCRENKLNDKGKEKLKILLDTIPNLKELHRAKEMAFEVFSHQSLDEFKIKLNTLKEYVYKYNLVEYYTALKTVDYWYIEICNMFKYGMYSNGKSERINTSLKRMKSLAYGFRNKERTFKLAKHKINKIS